MEKELTVGRLRELFVGLSDDTPIAYEGDVDTRWGQYATTSARVEDGSVVIS